MKNVKLQQLLDFLATTPQGVFADAIETALGFNERLVRALAAQSGGRILSGNCGYKLTSAGSLLEKQECTGRLRSQALQMQERANAIDAVWAATHSNTPPLPMDGNPLIPEATKPAYACCAAPQVVPGSL